MFGDKDYNCSSVKNAHKKSIMAPHQNREIVNEYERIQLIRKKAKTEFTHCDTCGGEAGELHLTETGRSVALV